jgi:hypothetical protein
MALECGIERALNILAPPSRGYIPQSGHPAQEMVPVSKKIPE